MIFFALKDIIMENEGHYDIFRSEGYHNGKRESYEKQGREISLQWDNKP